MPFRLLFSLVFCLAFGMDLSHASGIKEPLREESLDSLRDVLRPCRESGDPACVPEVFEHLEKVLSEKESNRYAGAVDESAKYLLQAGKEPAYVRLLSLADRDTSHAYLQRFIVDRLLDYRVARAAPVFCADRRASWPFPRDSITRLPTDHALPAEVKDAIAYHRALKQAIEAESRKGRDPEAKGDAWSGPELYRHIIGYLRLGDATRLDKVERMKWEGWCGTGSEALYKPKDKAGLLNALVQGDFPGAMIRERDHERIRLYLMCKGLDWEAYFLGAAFANDSRNRTPSAMQVLARYGSIEVLGKLLAVEPFRIYTEQGRLREWVEGIGTFVIGPGKTLRTGTYAVLPNGAIRMDSRYGREEMDFRRDGAAPAVGGEARQAALRALMAAFDAHPFRVEGVTFARIFRQADFPQRVAYLRKIAALPDVEARYEAESALKELGHVPDVQPSLDPIPVLITSKGKPFPDGNINIEPPLAGKKRPEDGWSLGLGTVGGFFELERSRYQDLRHSYRAMRVDKTYLGDKPFDGPFFDQEFALSEIPPDTLRLEIPLHRYELRLGFPPGFEWQTAQGARISLQRQPLARDVSTASAAFTLQQRIAFPALGDGVYRVGIQIPGLQPWWRDSVVISADRADSVGLQQGWDVIYTARVRDGADQGRPIQTILTHDKWGPMRRWETGNPPRAYTIGLDHEDRIIGLPPGAYTLRIFSQPGRKGETPALKAEKRFQVPVGKISREVSVIPLGDIWLGP